jgi:hypothetical protein
MINELPILVILGRAKDLKLFLSKTSESFRFSRDASETDEQPWKVRLLADLSWSSLTTRSDFPSKVRTPVTLVSSIVISLMRSLFTIVKSPTVLRLMPSRDWSLVFSISIPSALVRKEAKSRFTRTEREIHFRVITVVNLGKEIVSRAVTPSRLKWSMDSMLSPERVVIPELFDADKVPAIFFRPLSSIVPAAFVAIAMLPEKVEHEAMADASALLWRVVVAVESILQDAVRQIR